MNKGSTFTLKDGRTVNVEWPSDRFWEEWYQVDDNDVPIEFPNGEDPDQEEIGVLVQVYIQENLYSDDSGWRWD